MSTEAREIKFWDHSKRRNWFFMRAVAYKVLARPEMLIEIRECAERCWGKDPSQCRNLRLWRQATALAPQDFVNAVLADTEEAQETREGFPPYLALSPAERAEYISASHKEVAYA